MNAVWCEFADELQRWSDLGRSVDFWWRDDDATVRTEPLERLVELAGDFAVPLALAVIARDAQARLLCDDDSTVTVLQHGVAHHNGAAPGDKKSEFPAGEPVDAALARLQWGRHHLQGLYGARFLPVLVPPWNRISHPGLAARLADAGYCGLSRFGPRVRTDQAPRLAQVNTHVDVIDWKGKRGFVGHDVALRQAVGHLQARRLGAADPAEATGWLTHHAVHDETTWTFLRQLLECTASSGLVVWRDATELFAPP